MMAGIVELFFHRLFWCISLVELCAHLSRIHLQGKYAEAQPLVERAMAIYEVALGMDHKETIQSRGLMGDLYKKQGFFDKASPLLEGS